MRNAVTLPPLPGTAFTDLKTGGSFVYASGTFGAGEGKKPSAAAGLAALVPALVVAAPVVACVVVLAAVVPETADPAAAVDAAAGVGATAAVGAAPVVGDPAAGDGAVVAPDLVAVGAAPLPQAASTAATADPAASFRMPRRLSSLVIRFSSTRLPAQTRSCSLSRPVTGCGERARPRQFTHRYPPHTPLRGKIVVDSGRPGRDIDLAGGVALLRDTLLADDAECPRLVVRLENGRTG
jgi:hypothetical protein